MVYEIVTADPAGNTTVFVLTPVPGGERAALSRALLVDPSLKAEQLGFVIPPDHEDSLWRLEMAGGEFCGNAARSFGLFVARESGLSGKQDMRFAFSGAAAPVRVHVDTGAETAEAEIPRPLEEGTFAFEGLQLPVYVFEGITHLIAEDVPPDEPWARSLMRRYTETCRPPDACHPLDACHPSDALGVLFYDTRNCFMRPAVWVRAVDSFVFESSCGSGSAALGIWLAKNSPDGEDRYKLAQPGGIIEVWLVKQAGRVKAVSIGGKVSLSGRVVFPMAAPDFQ
jgi:diaminopimelate epimerase